MNVESTFNKILNPVEKHGELIGAGAEVMSYGISSFTAPLTSIMSGQVHLPNVQNMINDFMQHPRGKTYLGAAIAGYMLKEVTNNSMINKLGEILQKVGTGGLAVVGVEELLYYSTHADLGCRNDGFVRPQQTESIQVSCSYMDRAI